MLYFRTIALKCFLHTLPGRQLGQRAVVGIEVAVAADATDRAGGADLPVAPGIVVAGGGTPRSATGAARGPRIASVEVAAVVVSYPCAHGDGAAQGASVAGAD